MCRICVPHSSSISKTSFFRKHIKKNILFAFVPNTKKKYEVLFQKSHYFRGTLSTRRKCNNSFYFSLVQKNLERTDADMRVFGKRNYATCLSVKKSPNSNVRNAPLGSFSLTHSTNSFKIA